ncbi:MAG: coproporphyrinogen dehydrogenase HemZ [Oscillospiraceae bacterium]
MQIFLNNYPDNYEIEQLTRMFFKDTSVSFCKKSPKGTKEDFIYIRQNSKRVAVYSFCNKKRQIAFLPIFSVKREKDFQIGITAYNMYKNALGHGLPWGVLTGIRPVRLMRNLYKEDGILQNVIKKFEDYYMVSPEKTKLCSDIFTLQQPIISKIKPNHFSLYISIPFCPSRCSYCSFVSTSTKNAQGLMEEYVDKLCQEIKYTAKVAERDGLELQTIYMGGGTPTAITAQQLKKVMMTVRQAFDLSKVIEYTVEAGRPDCTDLEKLEIIKEYGADRVSINPQTFSDNVLAAIGRNHTHQDFLDCVETAKKVGFKAINMDLIAGLPEDTVEGFENSLRGCIALGAENITVHTLTLKRASNLVIKDEHHSYEDVGKMIAKNQILTQNGYRPYYMYRQKSTLQNLENVGFSQLGHESLYNIYIMEEIQTIISCGAGGVSKVVGGKGEIERVYNFKYPAEYVKNFQAIINRKDEVFKLCQQFGYPKD